MTKVTVIVIKDLSFADLWALGAYAQWQSFGLSIKRETPRQVAKRRAQQARWRDILKRIRSELQRRTKEVI